MGRDLDPSLDLWETAKPYLEKWMRQRLGLGGLRKRLEQESGQWAQILPQLPRLVHASLLRPDSQAHLYAQARLMPPSQQQTHRVLAVLVWVLDLSLVTRKSGQQGKGVSRRVVRRS